MQHTALVAYVPTPHRGYVELFRAYAGATLYVLGRELIDEFAPLTRHLPGNTPEDAVKMVRALGIFPSVRILTRATSYELKRFARVVMPQEDVSYFLAAQLLPTQSIEFDPRWRLRWHKDAALQGRRPETETTVTCEEFHLALMGRALERAKLSPDWWRQVGAVLVREGEILLTAYNTHYPHEQSAYVLGDPRSNFSPGERIEVSLALHAETAIISAAAREGIRTSGCDMFVSVFPCPPCAYAIANSGIQRLFYAEGYSLVAGAEALNSRGVDIVRVLPPPLS